MDENTVIKKKNFLVKNEEGNINMADGEVLLTEVPMLSNWKPTDS